MREAWCVILLVRDVLAGDELDRFLTCITTAGEEAVARESGRQRVLAAASA